MKLLKKFIISLIIVSFAVSMTACSKEKDIRQTAVLPSVSAPKSVIYVINKADISSSEYSVISSLQGLTAKSESRIYIEDGKNIVFLEKYIKENPNIHIKKVSDIQELLRENASFIKENGLVVYEEGNNYTVNMAFTVSGIESWLAVPSSLKNDIEKMGFEVKMDLTLKEKEQYITNQEDIFEKYKDRLNKNLIIHQSPELITLRDYAVATGAFCFYTDEKDSSQVKFREKVFNWANENAVVFGWSSDELGYVKQASKSSIVVIPSDHCSNLSILSALELKEPIKQKNTPEAITPKDDKHYIALVMSDGDNVQWYETTLPFREHYYDRINTHKDYKLSWTAPPAMYKLAPTVLSYVYDMATDKDRFVCGVSGIGYINPTNYNQSALGCFVDDSIKAMEKSDLQTITILDNSKNTVMLGKALEFYSAKDKINGGLMQINEKYEALEGKIIFSNDKPFISVRHSFWFSSDNSDEKISKKWIEEFAAQINELPCDIHSENGYSYINIHPWSTSMEDLNYLVSLLDAHIEIVYADELVEMVASNVKN